MDKTQRTYDEHVTDCDNLQNELQLIQGHLEQQNKAVPDPIRSLQIDLGKYQQWAKQNQTQVEAFFQQGGGRTAKTGSHNA